jgi:hypothetical protein
MTNVNPINRVPFGQERTREEYLARAAWEYDQASRLRAARRPVGYMALVEGHERAAKDYERAAEGRPSGSAHATRRDRAAELIASYQPWTSSYSNEAEDRAAGLAYQLTDIDRAEGRAAPPVGFSKQRYTEAQQVVRDTNRYGEKQQRLSAERRRSHAMKADGGLKVGDAVQLRWEPGTGGVIRRFEQDEAIVATPRGDRRVPADALSRVKKEYVERVRRSVAPRSTPASSHARVAKTKQVYVVQGNYGYGHGWEDLTAEDDRKEARDRLREYRENERGVPFRLIKRRERIEGPAGAAHAKKKKKKISPREAKQLLKSDGIDFGRDFHELGSQEVQRILEVARLAGYHKRKDAPGSTARMYFQYLSRQP